MKLAALNHEQIYYFELGRFVSQFSKAESMVFLFLADLIGMKKDECSAVISGAKTVECIGFIKRIYEARGQDVPADVLECLDRLGPLNKFRNDLLHWGADSKLTVTNALRALPDRIISYEVTPQMLKDATLDLAKATLILSNIISPVSWSPIEQTMAQIVMTATWQYKPPPQANNHQKNPSKTQGQKPRPEPSAE